MENREKTKKLKKEQEIQDICIKTNQIKPAFNMIWRKQILKIYLEETATDKAFNIAKNPEYDQQNRGISLIFYYTPILHKGREGA